MTLKVIVNLNSTNLNSVGSDGKLIGEVVEASTAGELKSALSNKFRDINWRGVNANLQYR